MIFQSKSLDTSTYKMNCKKMSSEITNILMTKLSREDSKEITQQLLEKLSSWSLKKTTPKKKKDKDSPKNPQNAYMFFCNSSREATKRDNSGIDAKSIIRVISEKWRTMSEEEKMPYKEMADKDKSRYRSEIDLYKKNSGGGSEPLPAAAPPSSKDKNREEKKEMGGKVKKSLVPPPKVSEKKERTKKTVNIKKTEGCPPKSSKKETSKTVAPPSRPSEDSDEELSDD